MVATIASFTSFVWGFAQIHAYILFPLDEPEIVGDLNVVFRTLVLTIHSMFHKYGLCLLWYLASYLSVLVQFQPRNEFIHFVRENLLAFLTGLTCISYPLILYETIIDNATKITTDEVFYLKWIGKPVFFAAVYFYIATLAEHWHPNFRPFFHFALTWNLLTLIFLVKIEGGAIELNAIGM